MQRIIQINIAGHLLPIEEDAYKILKDYLTQLERHFTNEPGKDEIIQDIESRIAELFLIRLETGAHSIDRSDVRKLIDTLGPAYDISSGYAQPPNPYMPVRYEQRKNSGNQSYRRLYRNPNDKMLGGVCSGLANHFDVDPVLVRLVFAVLFLTAGIGLVAYILMWAIIPYPQTREEMANMSGGEPMNFNTIKKNVGEELKELKQRAEGMSRDLKDFFGKKK